MQLLTQLDQLRTHPNVMVRQTRVLLLLGCCFSKLLVRFIQYIHNFLT